ncbi:MAG: hypothetical protein AAF546_02625 [Verrucomicrobiota bacterium]
MKIKILVSVFSLPLFLFGFSPDVDETKAKASYTGSEASKWIPEYGEDWFNHFSDDYIGLFPGGRSNKYHDAYIGEAWYDDPITKDWVIFDRKYIYEGQWFAVLWFYTATNTSNGFQQVESTIGMGKIEDGKMSVWIEYFDDSVGHMQELRIMPFFEEGGEGLPWPPNSTLKQEYRP